MGTVTVNGREIGEISRRTARPRKSEKGHSVVLFESWVDGRWIERRRLTCQCGRRYSGAGSRAFYSHARHLRDATTD